MGAISCNDHKNISLLSAYTVENSSRYVEHVFTSVPIKHRNRYKVKIEDISLPTEMDSDVEVQHTLMSRHAESNQESPDTWCHEHLRNLLQAQRTNKASVSTHSCLVDAVDLSKSCLIFCSANNSPDLLKGYANSEILNGEVELKIIDNLDTVAVSLNIAIRVLYLVNSSEVGEGSKRAFLRRRNLTISTGVKQHIINQNVDNVLFYGELQLCLGSTEMGLNSRLERENKFEEELLLLMAALIILSPFFCMLYLRVCLHLVRSKRCEEVDVVCNLALCTAFVFMCKRNIEGTIDRDNLLC